MRIYSNCKAAITDIGRELKKCASTIELATYQDKNIAGDSDYVTKEIQAFEFAILDQSDRSEMPNVTPEWLRAEFKERVSGIPLNPGEAYKIRQDVWEQFLEPDGKFAYTYSERMFWQLRAVINELQDHPTTRQAIIEMHDRNQDQERMGKRRIPCSMFYQFMIRDGKLDIIYVMRSSDFATHFQNDIHLAMDLQSWIANAIGLRPGKFIMFVSSLHIYAKDWNLLQNY